MNLGREIVDCKIFDEKKILYLYGELIPEEQDAIRSHLESCSHCGVEFQRLKETLELLKDLPEVVPSESSLANIRRFAGKEQASSILEKFRGAFTLPGLLLKRPAIAGAVAVVAIVFLSVYLLHLGEPVREPVTSLQWEDPFFEERIAQVEESLELLSYGYDTEEELYQPDTFEDRLNRIEEEVNQLIEEIESA